MSEIKLLVLLRCIALILMIVGAVALMYLERDGWGWLLFIAVLLTPSFGSNDDEKQKK